MGASKADRNGDDVLDATKSEQVEAEIAREIEQAGGWESWVGSLPDVSAAFD